MNVYVESNFVLELTLLQEQYQYCEHILSLCETGQIQLILPAYALAEPHGTLIRRDKERTTLQRNLQDEFGQLIRSAVHAGSIDTFQVVLSLLTTSGELQKQRLDDIRARLLRVAEIVPLDGGVLNAGVVYEKQFAFSPQDALIFSSVLQHLKANSGASCFLTRNSDDFKAVDIRQALSAHNCKLLFSFNDGLSYIQSQI